MLITFMAYRVKHIQPPSEAGAVKEQTNKQVKLEITCLKTQPTAARPTS